LLPSITNTTLIRAKAYKASNSPFSFVQQKQVFENYDPQSLAATALPDADADRHAHAVRVISIGLF
jgi:hypothetical protein